MRKLPFLRQRLPDDCGELYREVLLQDPRDVSLATDSRDTRVPGSPDQCEYPGTRGTRVVLVLLLVLVLVDTTRIGIGVSIE
eukprot:48797-Rhodomonas_salina.1